MAPTIYPYDIVGENEDNEENNNVDMIKKCENSNNKDIDGEKFVNFVSGQTSCKNNFREISCKKIE